MIAPESANPVQYPPSETHLARVAEDSSPSGCLAVERDKQLSILGHARPVRIGGHVDTRECHNFDTTRRFRFDAEFASRST